MAASRMTSARMTSAEHDQTQIAALLPELISGLHTQRDILAKVEKNQAMTTQALEHVMAELHVLKEDRVTEDRKISERVSVLESEKHTPFQQIVAMVASGVGMAVPLGLLVWFGIGGEISRVESVLAGDIGALEQRSDRIHERMVDHQKDDHPGSVMRRVEANENRLKEIVPRGEYMERNRHVDLMLQRIDDDTKREQSRIEDTTHEDIRDLNSRLIDVEKRTGVLFKEGNPY